MKNILFIHSSLRNDGSESSKVLDAVTQHLSQVFQDGQVNKLKFTIHNLDDIYQEDPHEIAQIVQKTFRSIDKKNLTPAQTYIQKIKILARFTKRLTRDLMRAKTIMAQEVNTIKVFIRNLGSNPVNRYDWKMNQILEKANPDIIKAKHTKQLQHLDKLFFRKQAVRSQNYTFQELHMASVKDIYNDFLGACLEDFADYLHLYIANKYMLEYLQCDTIVLGAPIYNHNIPTCLQEYLNYFVRQGLTFADGNFNLTNNVFYQKNFYAVISCGAPDSVYRDWLNTYFNNFCSFIGVKNFELLLMGNRIPSNATASEELQATIKLLYDKLEYDVVKSRYADTNIAKLRQHPSYSNYPQLQDFACYYLIDPHNPLINALETEQVADNLNLNQIQHLIVKSEDIISNSKEEIKRNMTSLTFTNFVFNPRA